MTAKWRREIARQSPHLADWDFPPCRVWSAINCRCRGQSRHVNRTHSGPTSANPRDADNQLIYWDIFWKPDRQDFSSAIVAARLPPPLEREEIMDEQNVTRRREPWNKGKLVGQKAPFKPKEIWAIRVRLQMAERPRELALFNLGIDSKLRACDLTALRVRDICHGGQVASRSIVLQRKTQRPVQLRSRRRRARRSKPGFAWHTSSRGTIFSRAGGIATITSARGSTPGWFVAG